MKLKNYSKAKVYPRNNFKKFLEEILGTWTKIKPVKPLRTEQATAVASLGLFRWGCAP